MGKNILVVDSLGALVSAILLLLIAQFKPLFGVPQSVVWLLLPFAMGFSVFAFLSYKWGNQKWRQLLKMIAIANLLYAMLTLYITWMNFNTFTALGIAYFGVEACILFLLAAYELKIANAKEDA